MFIQLRLLPSLALVGLIALPLAAGCGQKSPTKSGDPTAVGTILVSVNPGAITAGESSTITVMTVDIHGQLPAGVPITLTTTLGILDQTSGHTNSSGKFVTTLRTNPTDHGFAYVRAQTSNLWYENTVNVR